MLVINLECIHTLGVCLCRWFASVFVWVHTSVCGYGDVLLVLVCREQSTDFYELEKHDLLLSFSTYISPCLPLSLQQEKELGDSCAWRGSEADASGRI